MKQFQNLVFFSINPVIMLQSFGYIAVHKIIDKYSGTILAYIKTTTF